MDTPTDAQLLDRIAQIERSLAVLNAEVKHVRATLAQRRSDAGSPQAAPPAPYLSATPKPLDPPAVRSPQPAAGSPQPAASVWSTADLEELAGRYGMLALATLTGLAAVGTFLGWAIAQGLLGPRVRVVMGLMLAAALAGTGAWLRPRERSFGAALLGIALAVVHVCGWAMSPANLGLVSTATALALTVSASAALAWFAHQEDDEPLWCVGFGGAAVAPFVTSSTGGSVAMLAVYGGAVLLLGSWALRLRPWPIAGRVLTGASALFVFALLAAPHDTGSPLMALALAMVVAGAGVLPFAAPTMRRGRLRVLGGLAAIAAVGAADSGTLAAGDLALLGAIAAAALVWLAVLDASADLPTGSLLDGLLGEGGTVWDWVDAAAIPLTFLAASLVAITTGTSREALAAGGAVALLAAFVARRPAGALRDAAAFAASIALLVAAWKISAPLEELGIPVMVAAAVLIGAAGRWRPAGTWAPVACVTLGACTFMSYVVLGDRRAYEYTPFLTVPSAIAAMVVLAWFAAGRLVQPARTSSGAPLQAMSLMGGSFVVGGWVWAFFWGHRELVQAVSPTVSTLLVISYFAATSVVTVWVGRTRGIPELRHLGLVFALVAAGSAARGAGRLDAVWARVAGYLVTSAFLLALAWWYRRRTPAA